MEELGYALAPVPFLSNAAAGLALQFAGTDEQKERWLPGIASGEARGTVGMLSDGEARLVPDADSAEVIVLIGFDGSTSVVEASAAEIEPFETMDRTRRFARVRADGGEPLGGDCFAAGDRIATALAGETVGVAQHAMEMAVEYARERKQFGRPIGSYQAVSHRCAQMLLEVEGSRSGAYYAAWCADAEPDSLPAAASMAKAYSSDAGWRVCGSSLQVHGGIGFTWEHDLHFLLKRAKTNAMLYGSAQRAPRAPGRADARGAGRDRRRLATTNGPSGEGPFGALPVDGWLRARAHPGWTRAACAVLESVGGRGLVAGTRPGLCQYGAARRGCPRRGRRRSACPERGRIGLRAARALVGPAVEARAEGGSAAGRPAARC